MRRGDGVCDLEGDPLAVPVVRVGAEHVVGRPARVRVAGGEDHVADRDAARRVDLRPGLFDRIEPQRNRVHAHNHDRLPQPGDDARPRLQGIPHARRHARRKSPRYMAADFRGDVRRCKTDLDHICPFTPRD